jgi:hypothetical protein
MAGHPRSRNTRETGTIGAIKPQAFLRHTDRGDVAADWKWSGRAVR